MLKVFLKCLRVLTNLCKILKNICNGFTSGFSCLYLVYFLGCIFDFLADNEIEILPITFEHLQRLLTLEFHYKDPFDRIIISQALAERLTILSKDEHFSSYTDRINFWQRDIRINFKALALCALTV